MPNIIEQIRDVFATDKAAALNKLPELFKQYDEGRIPVLPCKAESAVFTIEEDYLDCENCKYGKESHYNKDIDSICCDLKNWHCPYEIKEHKADGFELTAEKGKYILSKPGEWGYEGLEKFSGVDGECYYSRESAAAALKEHESK